MNTKFRNIFDRLSNELKRKYFPLVVLLVIFVAIIAYFLSSYAARSEVNNNIIEIHFADNISEAHKATIERFNKRYAGKIKVIPVDLPFEKFSTNERKELLARALRSKSKMLDVFAVDQVWVSRFAKWSENLSELISRNERQKIISYPLESCYINGALYAVPLYMDIGILYYNEKIINSVVKNSMFKGNIAESLTWREFIELGKKFTREKYPFYVFMADNYEGLICSFVEMVLNQNREFFKKGGKFDLKSNESEKALKLLVDLVNKYKVAPQEVTHFRETGASDYFFDHKGVFLRSWPGLDHDIKIKKIEEDSSLSIFKMPLPHFEGTEPAYIFGGWNLMISKYSHHKNEALIFIKYLLSEESQKIMYEVAEHLPIKKSFYSNPGLTREFSNLQYFHNLYKFGVHRPFYEDYTWISDIVSEYVNKAIKRELSVEDALEKANRMIQSRKVK